MGQKLDNLEKEVEEEQEDNSNETDSEVNISFSGELSPESVETMIQLTGSILYGTYELMFHIPGWDRAISEFGYSDYPYSDAYAGIYQTGNSKTWMLSAQLDYYYMNRNLTGLALGTLVSPHPYFSVQLKYCRLLETLSDRNDVLTLLDIHLNYNRIKDENFALWWGIGIKGMRGDAYHAGPALNIGAEYFPIQPLSFSVHYNIGFIGAATVDDSQLLVNIHISRLKFTAGYQNYRAGDISFPGIIAGLGIYL